MWLSMLRDTTSSSKMLLKQRTISKEIQLFGLRNLGVFLIPIRPQPVSGLLTQIISSEVIMLLAPTTMVTGSIQSPILLVPLSILTSVLRTVLQVNLLITQRIPTVDTVYVYSTSFCLEPTLAKILSLIGLDPQTLTGKTNLFLLFSKTLLVSRTAEMELLLQISGRCALRTLRSLTIYWRGLRSN